MGETRIQEVGGHPQARRRQDAARNRDALIGAARQEFEEHGNACSLKAVARRAGVGVGTLYRHFPTRDALIEAVYADDVAAVVLDLCRPRGTDLDPQAALRDWLEEFCRALVRVTGLSQALKPGSGSRPAIRRQLGDFLSGLLERAGADGYFVPDLEPEELLCVVASVALSPLLQQAQRVDVLGALLAGVERRRCPEPVEVNVTENEAGSPKAGVGLTALLVAAARAIETAHPAGLISDPYAAAFVSAAHTPVPLPTRIEDVPEGDDDPVWGRGGQYFALRARVFDDFLLAANHVDGIRQIVLLGAGLDTRALRLDWHTDTRFFEVDRPEVLTFKQRVLGAAGAEPRIDVLQVPADLEDNWAASVLNCGLNPMEPIAWVVEGVLPYLPALTERRLIAAVNNLSPHGSVIGFEILQEQETDHVRNSRIYDDTEAKMGVHLSELFSTEARPDSAGDLALAGWKVQSSPVYDFTEQYGRGPEPGVDDAISHARWVMGRATRRWSWRMD